MQVLASIPLYPPTSRVGAWLSTHEVLAHLAARGHQVDVVLSMGEHAPYVLDGVNVHPRVAGLLRFVRDADIIMSHLGDSGNAAGHAAERGVPSVRMVHGSIRHAREQLAGSALAVFNSESLRSELGWAGPSTVMAPVVRPSEFTTTPGDRVTLVNLSENKGGRLFWQLAELLEAQKFLGVQGGYEAQVDGYAPNVELIGSTTRMRDEVYARTRVLLVPSIRESYGRVGIEAYCSGIPVIAHPTPGLRESLGDAGIFVDRDDVGGWVDALGRLAAPGAWAEASARALARAAELTPDEDLDRVCDEIEALAGVPVR